MTSHLILHKVRGEPAFDVAEKIMIGEEEGWIIPTSGHRAYPYKHWPLDNLACLNVADQMYDNSDTDWIVPCELLPTDWPDHYQTAEHSDAPKQKLDIPSIIAAFLPKMKRRI